MTPLSPPPPPPPPPHPLSLSADWGCDVWLVAGTTARGIWVADECDAGFSVVYSTADGDGRVSDLLSDHDTFAAALAHARAIAAEVMP